MSICERPSQQKLKCFRLHGQPEALMNVINMILPATLAAGKNRTQHKLNSYH